MSAYETFETPLGRFTVVVDGDGRVRAAAFAEIDDMRHLTGLEALVEDASRTAAVRRQIEEYFAGRRRDFDLPLAPSSTDFQRRYREEMGLLTYGKTTSYGELARKLGSSARATGRANATNPLCIIVPCHRVIGADGSLTGYAYGVEVKRALLELEGAIGCQPTLAEFPQGSPAA